MGDQTAYVEFLSIVPLDIHSGDYMYLRNHTYFVRDAVIPTLDVSRLKYSLTLYGTQNELEKAKYFILDTTGLGQVSKTTWNCTPLEFLTQMVVNLKRIQPDVDWHVGVCIAASAEDIELNDNDCLEMMKEAADVFKCDYYIDEFKLNLYKIEPGIYPVNLEVGIGEGLCEITANKSGDSKVITRLYPFGATTNMANGQRLSIPAVDAPGAIEVIEEIHNFEDIYPRIECVIESIVHMGENNMIRTAPIGFSISDYLIYGSMPMITFLTGELMGYEFVMGWQYDYIFTIEPLEITGGVFIPGPTGYNFHVGDEFVIWNINMPPASVAAAQAQLQSAAVSYLEQYGKQKVKLNVLTDDLYFARSGQALYLGQTLNVKNINVPFLVEGVTVNVIGYKNYINQPYRYESLVVGDVYYTRPFGTVVQISRTENVFKSEISGGDKYYRHIQLEASAEWDVYHNLDKRPSVTVTNNEGKQVEAVVTYLAPNHVKINFSAARTGYAECN
jgi:hypothetical protein